jgi:hypothetical protein
MKARAWWGGLTDEDFTCMPVITDPTIPIDQLAVVPTVLPADWAQMSEQEQHEWLGRHAILVKNIKRVE